MRLSPDPQGGSQPIASHDEGQRCFCVSEHRPAPLELNLHHVWPLYLGGPDEEWNQEFVCPNCHVNVHEILRAMMREDRPISISEFSRAYEQPVNRWAHHLAEVGYFRWAAARNGDPAAVPVDRRAAEA